MIKRHIMLQGTGSDVGKSLLTAGLCRLFTNQGYRVAPFKPQNMSNNAAVTQEGGEIGRAQALQARAARIPPHVHMNPVLLKPERHSGQSQIILCGQSVGRTTAQNWFRTRPSYLPHILSCYGALTDTHDMVIVEGAGSPAEVNLRAGDIANMGFACAVDIPVLLIADIHRGGVIASVVGTYILLPEPERAQIRGVIINNFHGDPGLFAEGARQIETHTGWPVLGIVPHIPEARVLPAEDSVILDDPAFIHPPTQSGTDALQETGCKTVLHVVALHLPHIANFDDLDTIRSDPRIRLTLLRPPDPIPTTADWVIILGSKSTRSDLAILYQSEWDQDLKHHIRRGGRVWGMCGGYQMLGRSITDPTGFDGPAGTSKGLGLLDTETVMSPMKTLRQVHAIPTQQPQVTINAYEIHMGETWGPDCTSRPLFRLPNGVDGAISADHQVMGTYLHGSLDVRFLGLSAPKVSLSQRVEGALDHVAHVLSQSINMDAIP